jgi:hypothetical protein
MSSKTSAAARTAVRPRKNPPSGQFRTTGLPALVWYPGRRRRIPCSTPHPDHRWSARRELPLDPSASPVHAFVHELRMFRDKAGMTFANGHQGGHSRSTLAEGERRVLAHLEVTSPTGACGGDRWTGPAVARWPRNTGDRTAGRRRRRRQVSTSWTWWPNRPTGRSSICKRRSEPSARVDGAGDCRCGSWSAWNGPSVCELLRQPRRGFTR